jgi:hypothetical protein
MTIIFCPIDYEIEWDIKFIIGTLFPLHNVTIKKITIDNGWTRWFCEEVQFTILSRERNNNREFQVPWIISDRNFLEHAEAFCTLHPRFKVKY